MIFDLQVCFTLGILAGNHFQRTGEIFGGIEQTTYGRIMRKVVRAINLTLKDDYLHMPSEEMLRQNAEENFRKYKLPNFGYAVDGVHMVFKEKPRQIPLGMPPKDFFNRKSRSEYFLSWDGTHFNDLRYSINAQIVGGIDRLIYDVDLR